MTILAWPYTSAATRTVQQIAPRIQQMIDVLLANQALICQYSYGHVELHYKDGQVQAVIKHQLLAE